jgi:lipoyl(octanoyl) transferase
MNSGNKIIFHDEGLIDFKDCWALQEQLLQKAVDLKMQNRTADHRSIMLPEHHLLFCEHPHVYTLGKSGDEKNLLVNDAWLKKKQATYYRINRGGDITYHGPGQLVGYPVLDLDQYFNDIHKYLRLLEEAVILMLASYGIKGDRIPGLTGVWVDADQPQKARKICAYGVRCSRWVTMHGFALNVNTNLEYFSYIVPCGITDKSVTSMQKELGSVIDMQEVKDKMLDAMANVFKSSIVKGEKLSPSASDKIFI